MALNIAKEGLDRLEKTEGGMRGLSFKILKAFIKKEKGKKGLRETSVMNF